MKKTLLGIFFCIITVVSFSAFIQDLQKPFPVVLQFNSECCGVPSDSLLREYVTAFKTEQKVQKITAKKIGPLGREGEYWLAFGLENLNARQKKEFSHGVKTLAAKLKDPGYAVFEENRKIEKRDLPSRATLETINF